MQGYINLFEGECLFMNNGAHTLSVGDQMIVCAGEHQNKEVTLQKEGSSWILLGDGIRIHPVQGTIVKMNRK